MQNNYNLNILVVDDEENIRKFLVMQLNERGYKASAVETGEKAIKYLESNIVHIVILDYNLPGINGLAVLKRLREKGRKAGVIMITAYGDIKMAVEAMRNGANDYLTKPFDFEEIDLVIQKTAHILQLESRLESFESTVTAVGLGEMIGRSRVMQDIYQKIKKISRSQNVTVLITGESGTGKELAARAIHQLSDRNDMPFLPINCSTIQENLLESELFGYEKGAFTDARKMHRGLFEIASGGTIFLDEIGDMPVNLQAKVLRVLQDRQVRRIGGHISIPVDVRIISATNKNLEELITNGMFREDLFYRLNVIPMHLPPLRERKGDVVLLANHFIEYFAHELRKTAPVMTRAAQKAMLGYSFPGNIRELRNIIERLMILEDHPLIDVHHLPQEMVKEKKYADQVDDFVQTFKQAKGEVVSSFEKEYLATLLQKNRGNVTRSAEQAGMERSAFQRLMRKYELRSENYKPLH